MFDESSLKKIDSEYFNIILMDDRDIKIQSRNTGHYWYLHCTEYPMEQSLIIFHKHFFKPYTYKNKLLELINYRHKESVKMLTYLFQNQFTSDQVWNHLENYFLGILPEELEEEAKKVDPTELEVASVQLQTGDSLTEDYDDWESANVLFDNDVIEQFGTVNIPLADYYNSKLIIGDNEIEVDLAWLDQKLLITSGDEEEILRETAKQSGWSCIPVEDMSLELIKAYFA